MTLLRTLVQISVVLSAIAPAVGQERGTEAKPPAQPPQPAVRVERRLHDFGKTWIGDELKHAFKLTNTGGSALTIDKIDPTFGCKLVGARPTALAPGESKILTFELDSLKLKGRYEKPIVITTNDPAQKNITLTLRGECRQYISSSPAAAGFGKIALDEMAERVLTLRNNGEKPLQLKLGKPSDAARFKYQLVETIAGFEFKLFVNTTPPYEPGSLRSEIKIETGHPKQPELRINAYAIVPKRLEVVPSVISLQTPRGARPRPDAASVRVVNFNNHGESPVQLKSVTSSDSKVTAEIHAVHEGKRYRVLVRIPAGYKVPEQGAGLTLVTSDTATPAIQVPIGRPVRTAKGSRKKKERPALKLIGTPVPSYALTTLDGVPLSNAELEFHPATVLNFIAPNCGFSKKQIPKIESIREDFESRGVRFVNVNQRMRREFTQEQVEQTMADIGSNLEIAMDKGNRVGKRFKVTGYPILFIVRSDGMIDHVISGNKKNVSQIVSEKLTNILEDEK